MALTAEILTRVKFAYTKSGDYGPTELNDKVQSLIQLTSGTGANQADILFVDDRSITASGTDDLDLAGVLSDAFGDTIAAAEIVAIMIVASASNTNNLVIGGDTNDLPIFADGSDEISLKPGGVILMACPTAAGLATVTAGTGDVLGLANSGSGTAVAYTICIIARSA